MSERSLPSRSMPISASSVVFSVYPGHTSSIIANNIWIELLFKLIILLKNHILVYCVLIKLLKGLLHTNNYSIMQQCWTSAFHTVVCWHKLGEVENEYTSEKPVLSAIFVPKIFTVRRNLAKLWQKISLHSFFWDTVYSQISTIKGVQSKLVARVVNLHPRPKFWRKEVAIFLLPVPRKSRPNTHVINQWYTVQLWVEKA